MGFRVGIDSGGTFTDLFAVDEDGREEIIKVPSTPASPDLAVRNALAALIDRLGGDPSRIEAVLHGTTVAVNAILQHKFPPIGLLVTRGFRHVLEMGRQTIPGERGSIYVWTKPARIVPLGNVREVTERLDRTGAVLAGFDEAECREQARWYRDQGINSVAICFINAYASGVHEMRAKAIFAEEHPDCQIATSCETLPEYREYERAITTATNALLMPILGRYIANVEGHLKALGIDAPLYIMKSAGGATLAELAARQPVHTALSGTAAAVMGSAWIGRGSDMPDLMTFDMGGTSTDVALIEKGYPALVSEVELDVYPIRTPAVDVVSVGAGGGSIASIVPGNRFQVGPRSAGADPGPACYGRGGTEPTVTDANVLLGRLPQELAGGAVRLDRAASEAALETLGKPLGLDALEMARGIIEIGELNMADAVRQISVKRGRDPRNFTLIAGGGAGPLHAASLGEILQVPQVLIPPAPGIGCSLGALVSDVREDFVMTDIHAEDAVDIARLSANFTALETEAAALLDRQGFPATGRSIVRSADLRYRGMRTELLVDVPAGAIDADLVAAMCDNLHAAHEDAYGYAYRGVQPVEIVNLRVTGVGHMRQPPAFEGKAGEPSAEAARTGTRSVFFNETGFVETAVYDRRQLAVGASFEGPAIVEQYDTTIVILPGQKVSPDANGNLLITTRCGQLAKGVTAGAES
ncbi:hydantoinase/oxoprolinase family protein [Sphingomonas crocodyli]|uniref:Hydantoinase/oxoprolinase family protein n=1 Tax=Sphingomonas crocodyli TaxID=1979270 RepID=A0A437LZY0_9SPHN|nr:hydantoinase/oxoprolinase family protein [Sphingomonas crocodyli]RVT90962.1 hydantoinase/oxoprolinase family protein [Sphingomonas crocodyli]